MGSAGHQSGDRRLACRGAASGPRFLLSAFLALLLPGCSNDGPPEREAPAVLRVPIGREVRTLDPAFCSDVLAHDVVRQLYEGLVDYDPRELTVVPRVARRWRVSEDGLEWRFEIHDGVTFLEDPCFPAGTRKVTAGDVKYSITRSLSRHRSPPARTEAPTPAPTPAPAILPAISGLEEFLARTSDEIRGISVEGPLKLRIRLDRRDPALLHFLALPCCYLVPREAVERYGEDLRVHPVGTGPFRFVSWDSRQIRLVRNPGYWRFDDEGNRLPYLDDLRLVSVVRHNYNRLYAEGEADVLVSYDRDLRLGSVSRRTHGDGDGPSERAFFVPWLNTIFARFNYRSDHPLVRNPRLRLALSCALALRTARTATLHVAARGLLPPGLPGYDENLQGQRPDLQLGRKILEEEGYFDDANRRALRIVWPEWDLGAGRMLKMALTQLEIDVELDIVSAEEFRSSSEGADVFRDGWVADYPDPQNFLQLFYSKSPNSKGSYVNAEFDRLFRELEVELDPTNRVALARRLESILIDDVAALFLRHERQSQLVSARLEDWETNCTNPLNIHFYERVRIRSGK